MNPFVNPKRRSISLPKGCKNLADVLNTSPSKLPAAGGFPYSIAGAKCKYCGGPAVAGSCHYAGDKLVEGEFLCEQCQNDLGEFYSLLENELPNNNLDSGVESLWLDDISRMEAEFMRQRVAARKRER
jgi:hypothetical protein